MNAARASPILQSGARDTRMTTPVELNEQIRRLTEENNSLKRLLSSGAATTGAGAAFALPSSASIPTTSDNVRRRCC
jgi:hypothetical protein